MNGLEEFNSDSIQDLKYKLSQLARDFQSNTKSISAEAQEDSSDPDHHHHVLFRDFYQFVFQFSRESGQKTIEVEIAIPLLQLLLAHRSKHVESFCSFLQQQQIARLTYDQVRN